LRAATAFGHGSHNAGDGVIANAPEPSADGERQVSKMGYRLAPIEVNIAEGGFAEFRICNEQDEPIATFGFADEHEA